MTRRREVFIVIGIIILALLLRLYQLTTPLADWHSFRQADTASVAREYVKNGIDLLHPRYHDLSNIQSGKDNPQGYRLVEFPLISGVVALSYPVFRSVFTGSDIHIWYRLISIIFSLISTVVLYYLASFLCGRRSGLLSAAIFAVLPYNVYYSRSIFPEIPLVTAYLCTLYAGLCFYKSQRMGWFIAMVVSGALSLLFKPTAIFMLVPLVVPALYAVKAQPRRLLVWLIGAVVIMVPLFAWRQWIASYPEGIPASNWLFNGNGIRLRPAWFRWLFYERLTKLILGFGGLVLFLSGIVALFTQIPKKLTFWFIISWLMGAFAYLVVFATGNVQHDYYQIPLLPLVSLLLGLGINYLLYQSKLPHYLTYSLTIISLLVMGGFSTQRILSYYHINNWAIVKAGRAVDKITEPSALVIAPYEGDTAFLYQTNRRGWPLGFDIDTKINQGADYYVTVKYDDEARQLEAEYQVLEKNDDYLIIKLIPKAELWGMP